ncbi:helix-turn-helix domain-containing protein [Flagellimonas olearia]|uniref:Helix-turn-helix domain-containing protein n=1 Tax=Flagellimonas olearia TaxID=552546 RepID=A0A6I1DYK0_9FLAO|nr:helix-turn-helix domain-containing protein [Allomuricauda olearia]KAB7528427.1 helix-turn-helix domain-containing protein [Allomuricauda olearia]
MKRLKFEDLPSATEEIIEKIDLLQKEISSLKKNLQPKEPVELMTRKEAANFLRISLTTLHHWTKRRIIKGYGLGNRVYYKKSEIINKILRTN